PLDGRAVHRTGLVGPELLLRVEGLAGGAVPPFVGGGIEVAGIPDAADDLLDASVVPLLGGADEVVVGEPEPLAQLEVPGDDPVGELDGRDALFPGRPLDVLPVLVGAGEEIYVVAPQAPVARQGVGGRGREDVPDVGQIVHVIDRGGDVEGAHGAADCSKEGPGIDLRAVLTSSPAAQTVALRPRSIPRTPAPRA